MADILLALGAIFGAVAILDAYFLGDWTLESTRREMALGLLGLCGSAAVFLVWG